MPVNCKLYTEQNAAVWNAFIESNKRNGTFLHSRKFFDHNPLNRQDDASLMFFKKEKLKAVLPAALYRKDDKLILHSHPRSTYGGFIMDNAAGVEEAMETVEATIAFAREKKVDEIIVRNPFRIFQQVPSDETDYAMWYHGFVLRSRELECAVKLDEHAPQRYENGAKYNIKKAVKLVEVKETEDYAGFWEMLTRNLAEKHGSRPVHTLEQFEQLRNLSGHDKVKLMGGFIEGKLVCGVLLFVCAPMVLHAQYIASDNAYQDVRPLNAVIDFIIKWGHSNGFSYFNLGTANEEAGRKINYGLFHFKEGFGGRGILRETMHLIIK
jgi:Acetyltransferase (GNAT) domain